MLNCVWWNNETPSAPNRWWNSGSYSSLCHLWTMPFSHFTRNKSAAEFSDVVQVWSPKQRRFVQLGRRTWKDNHESRGTLFQCWHWLQHVSVSLLFSMFYKVNEQSHHMFHGSAILELSVTSPSPPHWWRLPNCGSTIDDEITVS